MADILEKFTKGYTPLNLFNVKTRFNHLQTPDTEFGNNKWHMQLLLDDETAEDLKKQGFNIIDKVEKDGTVTKNILRAKKEVLTSKGTRQNPPTIVGPDGTTPFTDEVGSGSICNVKLSCKAWPVGGKLKLSCYVDMVQVVSHVARDTGFPDLTKSDVPF